MFKRNLVFIIILALSLLVRLNRLDFPLSEVFWWGDGTRDYLVANHILKYQEYPRLGPYNLLYESGIRNSPLYFYLLALSLIPLNHPVMLTFFNIIFQIALLVLIYLIAKKIFNKGIALTAMFLYSFSQGIIQQSDYVWQPYIMYPVALLGLYFFIRSYIEKSYRFCLASLVTLCIAIPLHMSAILWLLIFLIAGIFPLRLKRNYVFGSFALVSVSLLLLYSTTIPFQSFNQTGSSALTNSIGGYFNNLTLNLKEVLSVFNLNYWFLFAFLALSFAAYILGYIKNKWFVLTILMFFLPVILASFINKIRLIYVVLSLVPFIIWISVLISAVKQKFGRIFIISLFFIIFSGNLNFFRAEKPFENLGYIEGITDKVIAEIDSNTGSFRIQSYAFENNQFFEYPVLDSMLLVPLEYKLKLKLTNLSDLNSANFIQTNEKDYIFVSCFIFNVRGTYRSCNEKFEVKNPDYRFLKTLYLDNNLEIHMYKKDYVFMQPNSR